MRYVGECWRGHQLTRDFAENNLAKARLLWVLLNLCYAFIYSMATTRLRSAFRYHDDTDNDDDLPKDMDEEGTK